MHPMIVLHEGKEFSPKNGHPWIFSGALADVPDLAKTGDIVRVIAHDGSFIGVGTFSKTSSISVRIFTRQDRELDAAFIKERLTSAHARRQLLPYGIDETTTGYRLIFGESDGLPGIIIDRYSDVFVIQTATLGASNLLPLITQALIELFTPRSIVEKSDSPVRKEDALKNEYRVLHGEDVTTVNFKELNLHCIADIKNGQKTGYFLDQKDLRLALRNFAHGNILNIFSYTGATTLNALLSPQATIATNVDASQEALDQCLEHARKNGIKEERMQIVCEDAFQYLSNPDVGQFETVIIDPPALIKSSKDATEGKKAYHFLNRAALRKVKDGGIFVTSSCSRQFAEDEFLGTLRKAATQNNQTLHILAAIRQATDHPFSVNFPEAAYLKSFICRVENNIS
ncbi:class I SAM-dependent rRNA methyltransferase [Patescibacteria group bacterium]|nr:class I SAM-dependent rRNA methyltransferase [Patescibacteria group bacterium]